MKIKALSLKLNFKYRFWANMQQFSEQNVSSPMKRVPDDNIVKTTIEPVKKYILNLVLCVIFNIYNES